MHSTASRAKTCTFCSDDPPLRFVEVRIGKRRDAETHVLPIDVEPHPDGRVIERSDQRGAFKLLAPSAVVPEGVPAYRLHGASNCRSRR